MATRARPSALLVAVLLASACGDTGTAAPANPARAPAKAAGNTRTPFTAPKVDPNAPIPAPSTRMIDAFIVEVPELAKERDAILASERAQIERALAALRVKPPAKGKVSSAGPGVWTASIARLFDLLVPQAIASDLGTQFVMDFLVGHQVTAFLAAGLANADASKGGESRTISMNDADGKVAATATASAEGGQPAATLETRIDLPIFVLAANSKISIIGSTCPGPDGKVDLSVKFSSSGRAGRAGAEYDDNVEARITADVTEEAEIGNADFAVKQAKRSSIGGRQAYVESSTTVPVPGGVMGEFGPVKAIRESSKAGQAERDAANESLGRGAMVAYGVLLGAKDSWQSGNCIKIKATSPGAVRPGATSKIPVAVTHMKDGSSVAAKVTIALAGGQSVDPGVIPKAPGDVTHIAPSDRKAKMTIKLTATSRRGKDVLALDLTTAQALAIEGGADDFFGRGTICDITQPFTVEGGGNTVKFVPSSENGGDYTYAGNMQGFAVFGHGTYKVAYADGVPIAITATGPGSVKTPMGVRSNVGTEKYTLSPGGGAACP